MITEPNIFIRHMEVVREVSRRLADMERHDAAAEVLRAADQPEEAVSVAVTGGAWEKAREAARGQGSLAEKVDTPFNVHSLFIGSLPSPDLTVHYPCLIDCRMVCNLCSRSCSINVKIFRHVRPRVGSSSAYERRMSDATSSRSLPCILTAITSWNHI